MRIFLKFQRNISIYLGIEKKKTFVKSQKLKWTSAEKLFYTLTNNFEKV